MARQFLCDDSTVVTTKAGKLRGFMLDGTYIFQGIKYADALRFQRPQPVKAWEGIKDATSYGYVCPLMEQDRPNGELMVPHRYWPMNEHCQYLNIWTGSLDPKAKKPVMVWLHGGGFSAGSSIEHIAYDGENMSKFGDVVIVSINHRLNILGYLDLSSYGEKYANSGNAGNDDMIAALRWIKDNISQFGGDPDNVTLFGQSGGGMKVTCLLQMPEADGLFHKGIIQSGVLLGLGDAQQKSAKPLIEAMISELGGEEGDVKVLEAVPYDRLVAAYKKVMPQLAAAGEYVGNAPVKNEFYAGDPLVHGFRAETADVPLMIGTVFGEFAFGPGLENKYTLSEAEVLPLLEKKYKEFTPKLVAAYKKAYPDKCLGDLLFVDALFRIPTREYIQKRTAQKGGSLYSYLFTYEFPIEGGKMAWHCSEIPFVFHNTDKVAVCNTPGVTDLLEERICGAWISFARYGSPATVSLPQWPASSDDDEAVMIFDKTCEVRHNFDHELVDLLIETKPALPFFGPTSEDEIMLH